MVASCGTQLGMAMRWVMSAIELMPRASPKSAIPIGRPMAMSEPNATSRMRTAAIRPISSPAPASALLEREEEVAAHLDLQRRARRAPATSALRARGRPGSAPRPPVLEADERHAAVGRDRAVGGSTCGSAAAPASTASRARGVGERRAVVERRHDDLRGHAGAIRAGGRSNAAAALGVGPRHVERVVEVAAEGRERLSPQRDDSQAPMIVQGRRAARRPSRYRVSAMTAIVPRRGPVTIGRPDTLASAFRLSRRGTSGRCAVRRGRLPWACDHRHPIVLGRAPAPDPPARVWRDWVLVAVVASSAVLETIFRDDLVWRPEGLVVCVALAVPLLWRRTHPLLVTVIAWAVCRCSIVASPPGRARVGRCSRRVPAGAPVRAASVGVRTRGDDRDGVHPVDHVATELAVGRRDARCRALPAASRRARRRGALPDQLAAARAIRSSSASASSSRASCTTRSPTTSPRSRSGPRPAARSRPRDRRPPWTRSR